MKFLNPDPTRAYITNQLWLPKGFIRVNFVKSGLEFWSSGQNAEFVQMWEETPTHLIVPREFAKQHQYADFKFPVVDMTPKNFEHVPFRTNIIPRNQTQRDSMQAMISNRGGVLNLACGKGKTVIALWLAAQLKVPTIVIVHNTTLVDQWKERIREHLDYDGEIGTVQGDKFDWEHPICLAMIHTLAGRAHEMPPQFRHRWGLTIFDEVHHLAAPWFSRTAPLFYGQRFGLTATPEREDGRENVFFFHLGPIIYSDVSQDLVPDIFFMRVPTWLDMQNAQVKEEVLDVTGSIHLSKLRGWLGRNEERNGIIAMHVRNLLKSGRRILALSHSVEHLKTMHEMFPESGLCIGEVAQDLRFEMLQRQLVFATIQIAAEGLDEPSLDTLMILTPFGSKNWVEQAVGRIQRRREGKQKPLVVIVEDNRVEKVLKVCRTTKKSFRRLGYNYRVVDWADRLECTP